MATFETLEHDRAKLTVTIPPEAFGEAIQKAYVKTASRYNVPGFRKGKAPRKVVETMYGEGVFYEDAFDLAWGDAYDAALVEHALAAVDRPSLDIVSISAAEGVVFTAEVQLSPTVTLGAYQGIEVAAPTYTVEDSAVTAEIEKEREKNARFIEVDRAAENGDRVVLDYSGSVDGVKFDGGTAEDQVLLLGSGTFIPGFEEQLVGLKAGEEKDITVRFPDEYAAELAGKEAVFAIKLKAVQIKELPALDDEFAKDVSEFDTYEALFADKKAKMLEQAKKDADAALENAALEGACANASVEIPAVMIERQIDYMLRDISYRLSGSGISLEDYCKYMGSDVNALRESYRTEAERRVKMQLVIEAIGKAEGVVCEADDLKKSIAEYAEGTGKSAEEFEAALSKDDIEYLSDQVVAQKTVKRIVDAAKQVEKTAEAKAEGEEAAKPKKKPAAKKPADKEEKPEA